MGLPRWHSGKNPPANAGDARDVGSTPGSGRSPGREHGNPLQYSCLENSMDRGDWQATVQGVPKNQTEKSSYVYAMYAKLLQLCLTLRETTDYSLPDPSVHRILQARVLEWFAMLSSRGSS